MLGIFIKKKTIIFYIFLFVYIFCQELNAQSLIPYLTKEGDYMFVEKSSNILFSNKRYKNIIDLRGDFYAYSNSNKGGALLGLILHGKDIQPPKFTYISEMAENYIVALDSLNFIHIIDSTGDINRTTNRTSKYSRPSPQLLKFYNGILLVKKENEVLQAVNQKGITLFNVTGVEDFYPFCGEYAAVKIKNTSKYRLLDKQGKFISNETYDDICYLSSNLFIFSKNSKIGFIKEDGVEYLYGYYDEIEYYKSMNNISGFSSSMNYKTNDYPINILRVKKDGLYGYINHKLEYVITPIFKQASLFRNHYAFASTDNINVSVINKSGILINSIAIPSVQKKEVVAIISNMILTEKESFWIDTLNFNIHHLAGFPYQHYKYCFNRFNGMWGYKTTFVITKEDSLIQGYFISNVDRIASFSGTPLGGEGEGDAALLILMPYHDWIGYTTYNRQLWGNDRDYVNSQDLTEFNSIGYQKAICGTHNKWFLINKKGKQFRDSVLFNIDNSISIKLEEKIKKERKTSKESNLEPPPPPLPPTYILSKINVEKYAEAMRELDSIASLKEIDILVRKGNYLNNERWIDQIYYIDDKINKLFLFQKKYLAIDQPAENESTESDLRAEWSGMESANYVLAILSHKESYFRDLLRKISRELPKIFPKYIERL
jgi:hypothetical protein